MSRIADVLQKSRAQRPRRDSGRPSDSGDDSLRLIRDVNIPWQLDPAAPNPAPAPPPRPASVVPIQPARRPPPEPVAVAAAPPVTSGVQPARRPPPEPVAVAAAPPAASKALERQLAACADAETTELARTLFLAPDTPARHVLLAAVSPGGDAEAIAIGVAVALAREEAGAVCLIDCNLDGGTLEKRLDLDRTTGMSDAIAASLPGHTCAQAAPSVPGLWLMPAGSRTEGLRAGLDHPDTRQALRSLLDSFDFVVAQSTSAECVADAVLMGECFDGVVLILDRKHTTPEAARSAAAALAEAGVRVLGSVVSNRSAKARKK